MKTKNNRCNSVLFALMVTVFAQMIAAFTGMLVSPGVAQPNPFVSGVVIDAETLEGIPSAHIALYDVTGSVLAGGTTSSPDGDFSFRIPETGSFQLTISAIGYETVIRPIDLDPDSDRFLGEIRLPVDILSHEEIIFNGEQVRARTGSGQTTFYVNELMKNASNNGTDILRMIPGIQIDIQQNISMEGSSDIVIMVDGRERDRHYVNQLPASRIDRVEVDTSPSSLHDASASGVIHVLLAEQQDRGLDGHIHLEIPTSDSEVYIFPSYSLNYGAGKWNLFTSYNGEVNSLEIVEEDTREIFNSVTPGTYKSRQHLRQNGWSHRFHYGFDYFMSDKDELNFYGYFNPFSQEHSGDVVVQTGNGEADWTATKEDHDINYSTFSSLYYKRKIGEAPGHEIAADASFYHLNAENSISYRNGQTGYHQVNTVKPRQRSVILKVDYALPVSDRIQLKSGVRSTLRTMEDVEDDLFSFSDDVYAAYGSVGYERTPYTLQAGLRYEHAESRLKGEGTSRYRSLFPQVSGQYRLSPVQTLRFTYQRSVRYPGLYQLHPQYAIEDPYTVRSGNPELRPVYINHTGVEYSRLIGSNFIAAQVFYNTSLDDIRQATTVTNEGIFETRTHNLGDIHEYGVRFTGALSMGNRLSFNPYMRLFNVSSRPNSAAREHQITDRDLLAFDTGISAYAAFRYGVTAAFQLQYTSPVNRIQNDYYESALYFVSLEKAFGEGFKAGMKSGIPFSRSFTYRGSVIDAADFHSRSEGVIHMSPVPVWFTLGYRFASGSKRNRIERENVEVERRRKKGF